MLTRESIMRVFQEIQPLRRQWSSGAPGQSCSNEVVVKVGHSASSGLSLATLPQDQPTSLSEAQRGTFPSTSNNTSWNQQKPTNRNPSSEDEALFPVDYVWCINYQLRCDHYEWWASSRGWPWACARVLHSSRWYLLWYFPIFSAFLRLVDIQHCARLGNLHVQRRSLPIDCTQFPLFLASFWVLHKRSRQRWPCSSRFSTIWSCLLSCLASGI